MDDGRPRPRQQSRYDEPYPLPGTGRCETQDVLRTVVTKIIASVTAEHDPVTAQQPGGSNLLQRGPARRAVGRDSLRFPGAPHRHTDRDADGPETAGGRDTSALKKDRGCIGVEMVPPPEESWRQVHRGAGKREPWRPELRLVPEPPGGPLRCGPEGDENDREHDQDLTPEDLGGGQCRPLGCPIRPRHWAGHKLCDASSPQWGVPTGCRIPAP